MNAMAKEIQDAIFLVVNSLADDWVLDLRASFHTRSHREIM